MAGAEIGLFYSLVRRQRHEMLDDLNTFASLLLNVGRQHPGLSALATATVWLSGFVWRYTGDVELSERAKERRKAKREAKARATAKADAQRLLSGMTSDAFRLGRVAASVHLVDFSPQGYTSQAISTKHVIESEDIPEEYSEPYTHQLDVFTQKLARREIFEGTPKLAPIRLVLDRAKGDESKMLYIEYSESRGYVHQRAATAVFQGLPKTSRQAICRDPISTMKPFFSNSLGVSLAVITSDDHLLFVRRGDSTAVNQGRIVCSVVEGLTIQDVHQQAIDPFRAAQRALKEELSIDLLHSETGAISITGLMFNDDFHEWNFVGHVDLRAFRGKYTVEQIIERKSLALAHDAWEIGALEFIDFRPETVAGYMLAYDDRLTNYAKVTAVLALVCTTSQPAAVAAAFAHSSSEH